MERPLQNRVVVVWVAFVAAGRFVGGQLFALFPFAAARRRKRLILSSMSNTFLLNGLAGMPEELFFVAKARSPFCDFLRLIRMDSSRNRQQGSENNGMEADAMTIAWSAEGSGNARQGSAAIGSGSRASAVPEDRALVERAQGGDREAFEELVHRYDRDVLRIALNVLHKTEDARDVYQEAFLKIYKNLHRFRFECSFYTWMYRVVTNVCLDHLRRRNSRPEDQAPEHAINLQGDMPDTDFFDRQKEQRASSDPERLMLSVEFRRRISSALERLTPRERMVFEMKHYQGLKLRAIGDALGTSEETVKNSLFRATRKLREQLEGLL
jgi:RNA polymerase sigma-70 factor (ECF subfamily)